MSLIVSELVTNAARHAFSPSDPGTIAITVCVHRGSVCCTVADDAAENSVISPGRGTAIVNALARELGGTVTRDHTNGGSRVTLRAPLSDIACAATEVFRTA
jgi:two-component sensor histidine kinase